MSNVDGSEERVRQLAELAIIEAPIDPLIERICELATTLLDMPMAFVSLIDATQQHLIARHGVDLVRSSREDAICDLTIRDRTPLIIADTTMDPRVSTNPFVTGAPNIRFYAGIPLALTPDVPLGSFCVADTVARELTPAQVDALNALAAIVVGQIRHHQSRRDLASRVLELANKQALLAQTERFAKVGGFEVDLATGDMRWSDELYRLAGVARGTPPALDRFLALFKTNDRRRLRHAFAALDLDEGTFDRDLTLETAGGLVRRVHVHVERRARAGDTHQAAGRRTIGIVQDISERMAALGELEWMATHDSLTKLCNRARFHKHVEDSLRLADLTGHGAALMTLDIDRFKTINDTKGHDVGDVVLCAIAERLQSVVGARAIVARTGGDEFAVLVPRIESEAAIKAMAEDVLAHLRRPLMRNGVDLAIRATLGIAFHTPGALPTDLMKSADLALFEAKEAGRDGFAFYRPAMRTDIERRLDTLEQVRRAVLAGQIEPYYQPKVCLRTGRVSGLEALLRWHHPRLGLRGPEGLGEAFADRALAVLLGRAMRDHVVRDMRRWLSEGVAFGHIALNVAEPEFHSGDYAERLIACLDANGLPHHLLEVEVTESVFLGKGSCVVSQALGALSAAGISVALDDFGTGFASLTHLKQHPVTSIKIDRSFVMDIESDPNDATIVEALISLANALKIGIVAEGIETQAQLDFLRQHRCATGQGYLFAKPMPASRVPYLLRRWAGLPTAAARQDAPLLDFAAG